MGFYSKDHANWVIESGESWAAHKLFKPNAFPPSSRERVQVCHKRAALLLFYVNMVVGEVPRDREKFATKLKKDMADLVLKPDVEYLAHYDGIGSLAGLYGALNVMKSLLDVYAGLIAGLIDPDTSMTFKSAANLSGGKLINWLRRSAPKTYANRLILSDLIQRHSEEWITAAVKHRDRIHHYGELKGMTLMRVELLHRTPPFELESIKPPLMPDGTPVTDYCKLIVDNVGRFLRESIVMLPNVDKKYYRRF